MLFRRVLVASGLAALALYVWIAVAVYRSHADPEHFRAWDGPSAWIVGPPANLLNRAASAKIDIGMAALNDTSRPPQERLGAYRDNLRAAESLLLHSLRVQPVQARTLARLAAIRWELDPPVDEEGRERFLRTIATASRMSPGSAGVQKDLGDLLTRMGRTEEAVPYLARAIELDPAIARDAVEVLLRNLVPPDEIRARLPRRPEVLVALAASYLAGDDAGSFLAACEALLDAPTAPLLDAYTSTAISANQAARAMAAIDRLAAKDSALEAERLLQRSRLAVAAGDKSRALGDARAAWRLRPDVPRFAENLGRAALDVGDFDEAVRGLREALALAARLPDDVPKWRATLYRDIGRAEEGRKAADRAYDAYRKALELDPEEQFARLRLDAMHHAAGVSPAPR